MENKYYAAKCINDKVRFDSASGGLFFVLAKEILRQDGCVYGAAIDSEWNVEHIRVTEVDDLRKLQGSKYPQSSLTSIWEQLKRDLAENRRILFCGTPCQTQAIKNYVGECENILLCDIVCHGVASPDVFKKYIKWLEENIGEIKKFSFRDKSLGWKRQVWAAYTANGKVEKGTERVNTFRTIYYKHLAHRPACFECPYTTVNRNSDITLGDLWGIEKLNLPIYDNLGVSLVIIHSKKGNDWWNKINAELDYVSCKEEECLQPQLITPVEKPEEYNHFCNLVINGAEYKKLAAHYGYPPILRRFKNRVKNLLKRR